MSAVKAYHHTWDWEGRSNTFSQKGIYLPEPVQTEIIETAKERAETTILGELASKCMDQGIVITLRSCDVRVEVVRERTYRKKVGRIVYDYGVYHVDVKAKTLFDTDKPLTESPIAVAMVIAIGKIISMIILAVLVGWGALTFLDNISTRKSEVKTVTEWYDPETGELIKREEKSEKIEEPPLGGLGPIIGIIVIVALLLIFLVGLPRRR